VIHFLIEMGQQAAEKLLWGWHFASADEAAGESRTVIAAMNRCAQNRL